MSDYILYQCPSCSAEFDSSSEKSGTSVKCPSCDHILLIPSKSTFIPHYSVSSQQQCKLIDCPDCGTSISHLATACPKCGRMSKSALDQGKYTKRIYFLVICMVISWLLVQFISLFREEIRKDRARRDYLEFRQIMDRL